MKDFGFWIPHEKRFKKQRGNQETRKGKKPGPGIRTTEPRTSSARPLSYLFPAFLDSSLRIWACRLDSQRLQGLCARRTGVFIIEENSLSRFHGRGPMVRT